MKGQPHFRAFEVTAGVFQKVKEPQSGKRPRAQGTQ